jgi:hypothetical protein
MDNTLPAYPITLNYGKVTIDSQYQVKVQIQTDAFNQTFNVVMEEGAFVQRLRIALGQLTTNSKGLGQATYYLSDYDSKIPSPRVLAPGFAIYTPDKAFPEFDTSYPAYTGPGAETGKIIINVVAFDSTEQFRVDMSYGYQSGYPNGIGMYSGDEFGSAYTLPAAIYTVTEYWEPGWSVGTSINDPSGGSINCGRTAVINLAPGETVTVTFTNTQP